MSGLQFLSAFAKIYSMRVFNNRPHLPTRTEAPAEPPERAGRPEREIVPGKKPPRMSSSDIRARMEELKKETQTKKFERAKKMNERRLQGNSYMNEEVAKQVIPQPRSQADLAAEMEAKKAEKAGAGEHVQAGEGHLLNSDIAANDPKAPETQEKLKQVLSTGAFSFSDKERAVLDKILAGQA